MCGAIEFRLIYLDHQCFLDKYSIRGVLISPDDTKVFPFPVDAMSDIFFMLAFSRDSVIRLIDSRIDLSIVHGETKRGSGQSRWGYLLGGENETKTNCSSQSIDD